LIEIDRQEISREIISALNKEQGQRESCFDVNLAANPGGKKKKYMHEARSRRSAFGQGMLNNFQFIGQFSLEKKNHENFLRTNGGWA
jgi:hypothetical protein